MSQFLSLTMCAQNYNSLSADTTTDVHLKMTDDQMNSNTAGSTTEADIDLGPTPRTKYPLVVLVSRGNESGTRSIPVVIVSWILTH